MVLPTFRFSGRTYPQLARIVRVLCAVAGRCCQPLGAAVAVTVAVSPWSCSHLRAPPCPGPSPEPDCCRPRRQAGSVKGRRSRSRSYHEVTPQAPLTGSGCHGHSYGGFGGGHPDFHLHDGHRTRLCQFALSAWESVPSGLSRDLTCGAGCPRATVRCPSSPGLMAANGPAYSGRASSLRTLLLPHPLR
jgi:hypothetical protein